MAAAHKLVVGVTSAQGLMPKDGQGSSSAYVELCFHGQRFRTATKGKDLNPVWNKRFYFDISDPSLLPELALDAYVVHRVSESELVDLGKVRIAGASFLPFADAAAAVPYVLKKRRLSSHVKGTLALKVYITDDTSITASNNPKSILRDQSSRPHSIPLHHLKAITNNFSDNRVLGRGGFGVVYRGVLQNGEMIAVKKMMSSLLPGPRKQFENEVYHLMKLKHPNIVRCVGYCYEIQNACVEFNGKYVFAEQTERLLCLEYLHKRSLDMYLSDESSGLDWSTRYKIIKGISYGLCHLHEQNDKPILHLDLKPANILLDDSMEPKITDFGLSRLLDQEQTICTSSRDGTFGYMAPEFLHGGTITPKSDIFSLGVIIMEIVTGHRDYPDVTRTSSDDFIELALKKWRNTLGGAPGYRSLEIELQQVKTCIQVGLNCVNPERSERPTITEIINMLQGPKIIDCSISHATTLPICSRSADSVVSIDSDVLKSLAWRGFFLKKKKKYMLKNLPKLSRQELEVVCESFSNVIGSTPGTLVYKGTMKDGPEVSVISVCVLECHWTSQHELLYQNKVVDLARLNHENIAKFLGYCREKDLFSRMVVFEYASNGTLYEHLHHGEASQLCWLRRMKIAIGIAQGLRYLQTELQPPFSISELKSSSVYVTEDFTPKLVYFECWEIMFSKHEKALGQLNDKSAFPCLKQNNPSFPSPDSAEDKNADMQSNVFAFGIILLEIISGRLPYCKDKGHLVDWAKEYLQRPGEIWKLVDPELGNVRTEDLAVICGVVRRCIDPISSMRPTMQIIAETLETGIDLSAAGILNESNSLACAELALSLFNTFRLQSGCSKCIYEIIETDHPSACLICGGTHRTRIRLPHHACARKVGSLRPHRTGAARKVRGS